MMSDPSLVVRRKLTLPGLAELRTLGQPIVMVTAYDTPSARLAEQAGVDMILVGDSAGTTVLGGTSTVPVTLEEMVMFARAVARGAEHTFLVGDMPFGSYQVSDDQAVENAIRLVKNGGVDAVKLEGAGPTLSRVRRIVDAGMPVMGHVGLTPQSATMLGGYRTQGRTAIAAARLMSEAQALERAGCFAVVLEAIPATVAEEISNSLRVPTIGIGAGKACSGQVLVWHDLLGLSLEPRPRFVKTYANLADVTRRALTDYANDVRRGVFPGEQHAYGMPKDEQARFESQLTDVAGAVTKK